MKIGENVRLKGGGPLMTIREIDGDLLTVDWFVNGDSRRDRYHSQELRLEEDDDAGFAGRSL